jgi:DNA-binding transcriptional MerR regulator
MVNEQIMIDTVSRMIEAGIDDATIISTLTDAGLTQEQCLQIIDRVKQPPVKEEAPQNNSPTIQEVQNLKNVVEAQSDAQTIHAQNTSTILDEHEQQLAEVSGKINSIQSAISTKQNPKTDSSLAYRLSALEQKLEEVNSACKAQLDLMQKILEVNRKVLTELEAKK